MPKSKRKSPKKSKKKLPLKLKLSLSPQAKQRLSILMSLILILIGLLFLGTYINIKNPAQDFTTTKTEDTAIGKQTGPIRIDQGLMNEDNASEPPSRVVIPNVSIDLKVTESAVKDGYWEVSETNASHGMGSANPGKTGNSVIFAHARTGLFYNLKDVEKNDIVYVFTQKRWFAYKVTNIQSVYPDQVEVIAPTKDQTLTLYTCTGYSDEKRLIVTAKPVKT